MATIERRSNRFRLIFYYRNRRYSASLKTTDPREAEAIGGSVDRTLMLLQQGAIDLPRGADLAVFVLSGGKRMEPPKPPPIRTFAELRDRYIQGHEQGAMEANSLDTVRMHLRHFERTLGVSFPILTLTSAHVQQHIDRRSRQKGIRKKPLSPTTIKKEVTSMRACWNWGVSSGLLQGSFPPNKALNYPKGEEKRPFQTREEIERAIARGGLSPVEIRDLWDGLFLTLPEIQEFQAFVQHNARHDFVYPMIALAAHSGARRSELLRARIDDVDFGGQSMLLRERKRVKGERSFRRVPLSPLLMNVLTGWLAIHPGGQFLFCHRLDVPHSKKSRDGVQPLTRDEANDHFRRTVAGSTWEMVRGWHTFRHSFVSNCVAAGIDQRFIDEWVGHPWRCARGIVI